MRSKIKYELEKKSGFLQISRMLHSAVHYPSNYGFIPQTYCQDHDPLDILVLSQEPVIPGCVMKARPIGMLRMIDQHLEDIKIIAVHADDPMFSNYKDISQLPPHVLLEIRHFFEIYKELEKAELPVVEEFQGRIDAYRAIRSALALTSDTCPNCSEANTRTFDAALNAMRLQTKPAEPRQRFYAGSGIITNTTIQT